MKENIVILKLSDEELRDLFQKRAEGHTSYLENKVLGSTYSLSEQDRQESVQSYL